MNDRALLLEADGLVPTRLGDTVLARLAGAIADGRLKPGDPMPSEGSIAASFGVSKQIAREAIRELAAMGYAFQFITLAGFHSLNHGMFELARGYEERQMSAFVDLQEAEFASAAAGFTAHRHHAEVGTGYFDRVATALNPGSSTLALAGSTETAQFH